VDLHYRDEVYRFYDALSRQNIQTDVISVDTPLEGYKLLFAPVLYMVKPGYAEKLKEFTRNGGIVVTTYFSGMVDERDLVTLGGYPGELRELFGVWVEETDVLIPGKNNTLAIAAGPLAGTWSADLLCDIIHPETAEPIAVYADDFYAGTPAICRNQYGAGEAWYIGARPDQALLDKLTTLLAEKAVISPVFPPVPGIEATRRIKAGHEFTFVLNHNNAATELTIPFACRDLLSEKRFSPQEKYTLPSAEVLILEGGESNHFSPLDALRPSIV
jgi:beta-galactosidase